MQLIVSVCIFNADCITGYSIILHIEVLGSISGHDKSYMENSNSAVHPAHSAVMSKPGLYLVEGKAAKEWLAIAILMLGLEMKGH